MRILKANTAVRLVVGPLCDKTTGLAKPSMTVTNMAMNMWHEHDDGSAPTKTIDAVSFTASGGNNDMVELAGGYYDIEITAAQLNITAGRASFCIYDDDVILPYFEEWLVVPANVFDSIMGTDYLDVNAKELGGTTQTGNDVGADVNDILADTGTDGVLISTGTGAKQLDITSGVVKANLAQILGTVLTETAGLIAAGFKKFFNVATPTGTVNSLPDAAPGANGGVPTTNGTKINQTVDLTAGQSIAANGGTVDTATNLTNLPAATSNWLTAAAVKDDAVTKIQNGLATPTNITAASGITLADDAITSAKFDESTAFPIKSADSGATIIARAGDKMDLVDAPNSTAVGVIQSGITVSVDEADIRSAVGLATANLDTQLSAIVADTNELQAEWADGGRLDLILDTAATRCGTGTISWEYTVTDGTNPVANCNVWVSTDAAGTNIIASGTTNSMGKVTFLLDAGTVYLWRYKLGYNATNPDIEVVS